MRRVSAGLLAIAAGCSFGSDRGRMPGLGTSDGSDTGGTQAPVEPIETATDTAGGSSVDAGEVGAGSSGSGAGAADTGGVAGESSGTGETAGIGESGTGETGVVGNTSGDTTGAPVEPYTPCDLGCPTEFPECNIASQCTASCEEPSTCPLPSVGGGSPNFGCGAESGLCYLLCAGGATCPDDMICAPFGNTQICGWPPA